MVSDADAIAGLMDQLGYHAGPELIAAKLDVLSRSADDAVFVLVDGEQIVGVLSGHCHELFHVSGRLGRITSLVVDATFRGLGYGCLLVDKAIAFFQARSCVRVEVTSGDRRLGAHEFYRSVGFVEDERRFIRSLEGE